MMTFEHQPGEEGKPRHRLIPSNLHGRGEVVHRLGKLGGPQDNRGHNQVFYNPTTWIGKIGTRLQMNKL